MRGEAKKFLAQSTSQNKYFNVFGEFDQAENFSALFVFNNKKNILIFQIKEGRNN